MVTRAESTVHDIPLYGITRAAIGSDQIEFQAANGGVSGNCTAASIAALGGPPGPTGPPGPAMMPTPYDFGAVGNGTADDTVAMQAWLDAIAGGAGYGKAGTFTCTSPILIHGNTTIYGAGVGSFFIQTDQSGAAQDYNLMRNQHFIDPGSTRLDKNIQIYNATFQGDPDGAVASGTALLWLYGVENFTLQNCLFRNRKLDCETHYNCLRGTIDHCEFTHYGNGLIGSGVSGNAINGYLYNYEMKYTNNYIHDSQSGGGIWAPGKASTDVSPAEVPYGFTITGNQIFRVWEFGLVGVPAASVVSNNVIVDVKLCDVSGHGCEMGGDNYTFTGNFISFCDNACAYFNNLQNVVIANNIFNLPCQATPTPEIGALVLATFDPSTGAGTSPPHNVTITGNQFSGTDGNGYCAIEFVNFWGPAYDTHLMTWINCNNNNTGPSVSWAVEPIFFFNSPDNIIGEQFVHRDNNETPDVDEFCADAGIGSGSSGTIIVNNVPFRPRRIEFVASVVGSGLASSCQGCVDFGGIITSTTQAASAGGFQSTTSNTILLLDGAGATLLEAVVDSYINDGFIIAITGTTTQDAVLNYTCYP